MMEIEEEVTPVYCQHVCNLCHNFYTEPKILPCDHYFCCHCLGGYIQSRVDAFEHYRFPCPLCQVVVSPPDPHCHQTQWALQFPTVDIESVVEDAHHGVYMDCRLCQKMYRPRKLLLEYYIWCYTCRMSLCKDCETQHRNKCAEHYFMPIVQSTKVRNKLNYRRACAIHRDQFNDYYCPTCLLAICTKCVEVFHYRCKEIAAICEDYSDIIPVDVLTSATYRRGSSQYSTAYKRLSLLESDLIEPLKSESLYSRSDASSPSQLSGSNKRSSFCESKDIIEPLKSESLYSRSNASSPCHSQLSGSNKPSSFYESKDFIEPLKSESVYSRSGGSSPAVTPQSSPYKKSSFHEKGFLESLKSTSSPCKPIKNIVTIPTEETNDIVPPLCEDLLVITSKGVTTIIVADVNNNCLKTFKNKISSDSSDVLKLSNKPYRLALLGNNHIAATLPLSASIVVLKFGPKLEVRTTIKTEKRYCGIIGMPGHKLLVSTAWSMPVTLDVVNSEGEILYSVQEDNMGRPLLAASLNYLKQAPSGDILISDWSKETLICLARNLSSVVWKYQDSDHRIDHPLGFDCDKFGQIFVADFDGNSVMELSPRGEFERLLLTGIDSPKSVAVDGDGKLYVLLHDGSIKIIFF